MKWRIWLDSGASLDSETARWEDVPDRVIAMKIKYPTKTLLLYGLSHYPDPGAPIKAGADIPDERFASILEAARESKFSEV